MSRVCTVCRHEAREAIDAALVAGRTPSRTIAASFGCSRSSLVRHFDQHVPKALAKAGARKDAAREDSLDDLVHDLDADARRIQASAEKEGDLRTAVMALKERRGLVELRARAVGLLRAPASAAPLVAITNTGAPVDWEETKRQAKLILEVAADEERDRQLVSGAAP